MANKKQSNQERAERARAAMRFYKANLYKKTIEQYSMVYEEDIIDVITDMLHLHSASPNKTRALLALAQMNYEAERK